VTIKNAIFWDVAAFFNLIYEVKEDEMGRACSTNGGDKEFV
jgi:hypothetical protein